MGETTIDRFTTTGSANNQLHVESDITGLFMHVL